MDRIDEMRAFTRVVEARSFRKAASDLSLSASTVTDVVQRSERRLGVRLLDRTTRSVSPTPEGTAWYRHCLRLLADVEDAEASIRGNRASGRVRLDVIGPLFRHFLLPRLPDFLARHPDLDLVTTESDSLIDLVGEGVDCVLRAGPLSDSGLIQRRVALLPEATLAAPDYLKRVGTPQTLNDLDGHRMIGFFSTRRQAVMPLEFTVDGTAIERLLPLALTVASSDSMIAAAQMGLGLIQVPRYRVRDEIAAGTLVEVLPQYPPEPLPLSLIYPEGRRSTPRVNVVIDWLLGLKYDQFPA